MTYTNKCLVEYAKECLELGNNSVYVYGSFGNKLTTSFCESKYKQYPTINTSTRTAKYKKLCDGEHYGFDCVGLIKSYYWGGYGDTKYDSKSDVSANGMYSKAKVKGDISTIDKYKPGLLVQMDGHIGISVGDGSGDVIECTISTKYAKQKHNLGGICKTKLSDRKWLHWLECPYIEYVETTDTTKQPTNTKPSASSSFFPSKGYWTYGDMHENVGKIAKFMYKVYPAYTSKKALGNYYGKNLQNSIKEFQKRTGLGRDGSVGPKTLAMLKKKGFKY